jgi:hypothetical protein
MLPTAFVGIATGPVLIWLNRGFWPKNLQSSTFAHGADFQLRRSPEAFAPNSAVLLS